METYLKKDYCACNGNTLPRPQGAMGEIIDNILRNSWIKQENLAFSAALALMAVVTSRKVIFGGLSPNLYLLNISPSGSGKDSPQKQIVKYLVEIGADFLIGSGDYVSDASLMNGLESRPVRLDILDEAGGILKTVTRGGADYNRKLADILCELYTTSNGKYLGRTTAEGQKGSCYRPNVSILASTTPTGFSEAVSREAIEKGLLGRFLFFLGDGSAKAERLRTFPSLPESTKNCLRFWAGYRPEVNEEVEIGGIEQMVTELGATEDAHNALDDLFQFFDEKRRDSSSSDPMLPIISRGYQQAVKLMILHACSRVTNEVPVINTDDVAFGKATMLYFFDTVRDIVYNNIYEGQNDKELQKAFNMIRGEHEGMTKRQFSSRNRNIKPRRREELIRDLVEQELIIVEQVQRNGRTTTVYRAVK